MPDNKALARAPVGNLAHFNERRGFERVYYQNPEAQARGAMFLIGFLAVHEEFGPIQEDSGQVAAAIKTALGDFVKSFPEFMVEGEMPRDFGGGTYTPNQQLVAAVHRALSESPDEGLNAPT